MSQIHVCQDSEDVAELCPQYGLFIKPISRINISIQFPSLKQAGKSVSSWDIIERIKALVLPDTFISIKVVKNTLEFIRFEGDLENKTSLKSVMGRLEGRKLKVTSIKEPLKILVAEAKVPFPSKYDWDSFFRDAKQMNEMKSGERPDTVHFQNLPTEWFCNKGSKVPSMSLFRRVWGIFGEIRCVDIPMLDPYRHKMKPSIAGVKTFTFNHDLVFEAYVQFKEYLSFVKLMDSLRKSFLLLKKDGKSWVAAIKVDFDKSKHMSEESIKKREIETERLRNLDKNKEPIGTEAVLPTTTEGKPAEAEIEKDDTTKADLDKKLAEEERKYLIARRKLEAIRVMDFLFERVKESLLRDTVTQPEENPPKKPESGKEESGTGKQEETNNEPTNPERQSRSKLRNSPDDREHGINKRRNSPDHREHGSNKRRNSPAPADREHGSNKRRNSPDDREHGSNKRRNSPDDREHGSSKRRNSPDDREHGSSKRRNSPADREHGSSKPSGLGPTLDLAYEKYFKSITR